TPAGIEIPATLEIVGEYAVDLQIDAWGATSVADPTLVAVPGPLGDTYGFTQLLRGLHLRVSVRSREADRDFGITAAGGGTNDHYRIGLKMPVGPDVFARVRTFQSDIPLRNLENSPW